MKFADSGSRRPGVRQVMMDLGLDVRHDKRGEYFLISRNPTVTTELTVLDVQPADRHLVLMSRSGLEKHRYCSVTTSVIGL